MNFWTLAYSTIVVFFWFSISFGEENQNIDLSKKRQILNKLTYDDGLEFEVQDGESFNLDDSDSRAAVYQNLDGTSKDRILWPSPDDSIFYNRKDYKSAAFVKNYIGEDPKTGKKRYETFVPVHIKFSEKNCKKRIEKIPPHNKSVCESSGWMNLDQLEISQISIKKKIPLQGKAKPCVQKSNEQHRADLVRISRTVIKQASAQAHELLKKITGRCSDSVNRGTNYRSSISNPPPSAYVKYAMPEVERAYTQEINNIKESGKEKISFITKEQVIQIDALARTLYSEMNSCTRNKANLYAVAAVIKNRQKYNERNPNSSEFSPSAEERQTGDSILDVITRPYAFSCWNVQGKNHDKTLLMGLCPTIDENSKENWKSALPLDTDLVAWDRSLKVATEAILSPEEFNKKTSNLKNIRLYVSNMAPIDGTTEIQPQPTVAGSRLSPKCITLLKRLKIKKKHSNSI